MTEFSPQLKNDNEGVAEVNLGINRADHTNIDLYFDDIRQTPLLDREEVIELAKAVEAGLMAQHMIEQKN